MSDQQTNPWRPISEAPRDGTHIRLRPGLAGQPWLRGFWTNDYGGVWYAYRIGHLNGLWKPTEWREDAESPHDR